MFSAVVCYSRFFSQPNTKHAVLKQASMELGGQNWLLQKHKLRPKIGAMFESLFWYHLLTAWCSHSIYCVRGLCCAVLLYVYIHICTHIFIGFPQINMFFFVLASKLKSFLWCPRADPRHKKLKYSHALIKRMYVRTYVWKKVVFIECCGLAPRFHNHWQGLCQMTVGVLHVRARRDLGDKRFGHDIIMFRHNVKNIMIYSTCNKYIQICSNQLQDPIIWHLVQNNMFNPEANDNLFGKNGIIGSEKYI